MGRPITIGIQIAVKTGKYNKPLWWVVRISKSAAIF